MSAIDRLIIQTSDANGIAVRDKDGGPITKIPLRNLVPCLRRLTHLPMIDVSQSADYCYYKPNAQLRELTERYYGKVDGEQRWKRIVDGEKTL